MKFAVSFCLVLSLALHFLTGCESAESLALEQGVEPSASSSSRPSQSTPSAQLEITPKSTTFTPLKQSGSGIQSNINAETFSLVNPPADYTFTWSLSNPSLGAIDSKTGTSVTYQSSIVPSADTTQRLTVRATRTGSPTLEGFATILQKAR